MAKKKRVKPRWGRIALVGTLALVLLIGVFGLGVYLYANSFNSKLDRTDPFSAITGDRPPKIVDGAFNILLLGSDSRDPDAPIDKAGKWRTDTIVLMHVSADHQKAYLVSFPRDLYVHVPQSADGQYGNTMAKLNAAYAWGGLPLMVQTVEGYTGVRIDHVAIIDFAGFKDVVDALGGVDLKVEKTIKSVHKPYRTFKKGTNHMNGTQALDWIRQRYQFPDGDFARIRHQQEFLKAIMDKAVSTGTLANPVKLNNFLNAVVKAVKVDKEFDLVSMALQFRNMNSSNLVFLTSPHLNPQNINGESVVPGDKEKALGLYDAMAKDKVGEWVAANPPSPAPN
ncbi:LCP family protein [Luedemannella flava]|uniref:LCP family protein n=1 Tax=Luedemannella flava TaxID=349316 RepID=A0ABN2LF14_9ACTN